ncbi:MAG: cytidine deaminase [Xanthomonadales bacterium]|nr:cytidine deaminase [Xanthomonadales bacterium]
MTDLQALVDELLPVARAASERAWSPFSGVQVGAVVRGPDGAHYAGCNVESASYGLTQCAERNALAAAVAAGAAVGKMDRMLIFAKGFDHISPCGACRQVISELMSEFAVIIACSDEHPPRAWTVGELFPEPFRLT